MGKKERGLRQKQIWEYSRANLQVFFFSQHWNKSVKLARILEALSLFSAKSDFPTKRTSPSIFL